VNELSERMPQLVLLVGAGRTGKDTVGAYLKRRRGFARASFAKPLYDALQPLYGISALDVLDADKEAIIPRLGRSLRELVQHLGDHVRQELGPDILIRRLVERTVARGEWAQTDLVITDGRLDIEIEWARHQGAAIWWISRENAVPVRPHATESIGAVRVKQFYEGDIVLKNDGAPEQLFEQVDRAIAAHRVTPR
jgi:hypothetical protein